MAILEISSPRPRLFRTSGVKPENAGAGPGGSSDLKSYTDRFLKLIPSEALSVYLVGIGYAKPNDFDAGWSACCFALAIILRSLLTWEAGKPNILLVLLSAIAFFIYIPLIGGLFPLYTLPTWVATLAMLFIVPIMPFLPPDKSAGSAKAG